MEVEGNGVKQTKATSQEEPANIHSEKVPMLSEENVKYLESVYKTVQHPTDAVVEYLADDLVVPMTRIKAWFRKKRGDGRKTRGSFEAPYLSISYNPQYGMGGLGALSSQRVLCRQVDDGMSEIQQQLNNLKFSNREDDSKSEYTGENTTFINGVLDTLLNTCSIASQSSLPSKSDSRRDH